MVRIQLTDLQNQEIVYQGKANLQKTPNGSHFTFGDDIFSYSWKVYSDTLIIDSRSEVHVHLVLKPERQTNARIQTEYGEIRLHCYTSVYTINNHYVEICYKLKMEDQEQLFHFRLEIEGAEYAIH